MRTTFAALVVALLAAPAVAQPRPDPPVLVFAGLAPVNTWLGYRDAQRTVRCVEAFPGRCIEANPLFNAIAVNRGIRHSMTVKVGADLAVSAGFAWALHRWPHRRWAIVAGYGANAVVKGWVIAHNKRVMEDLARAPR